MADQKVSFRNIGTSIPVDNVQALAASVADSGAVPPRYIRPEVNAYPVAQDGDGELPVIDFARLLDLRFSQEESAKLHYACAEWGFFQVGRSVGPSQYYITFSEAFTHNVVDLDGVCSC